MRNAFLIILIILSSTLFAHNNKVDSTSFANAKQWAKNQQIEFIENEGQFTNTDGKPADNVLFKASYGSCDIYITDKGLSYVYLKIEEEEEAIGNRQQAIGEKDDDKNKKLSYYRLDMDLIGATINKSNIIKEYESKQGHYNYFYPHCPKGIYNVKGFGKITIKNIYDGIDWVIYTNPNNKEHPLKYDFIVHPNADYNNIKIKYQNTDDVTLIDNDTKLKIQTIAGTIEEGNLYSYLNNKENKIESKFILGSENIIKFKINEYDKNQTLIIDPLVWATYYGGSSSDGFRAICTDSQDNIFITGYTYSSDFPTLQLAGAYWQPIFAGGSFDIIVLKFNSNGVRLWSTYYGGNGNDLGYAICKDSQDNIYIGGTSYSTNFPTQFLSGAYWQSTNGGSNDAIILKFNNSGVCLWATYYGGTGSDQANSICIDNQNNLYITGYTQSANFPTLQLTGAYWQSAIGGSTDAFILKFNNAEALQWATYYGGNSSDMATSICIDSQNNIYITGFALVNLPTQGLTGAFYQATNGGSNDAFILKFNNSGVRLWATYYGGNNNDYGYSICADSQDNIYVLGITTSANFPTQQLTGAYWQAFNLGGSDFFILKFNSFGVCLWSTYYGGTSNESFTFNNYNFICRDSIDNVYITGFSMSTNFPTQQMAGEYWQPSISGSEDAVLMKFNKFGVRQWATYYGSIGMDYGTGLATDKHNNVYFVGEIVNTGAYTINPGYNAYYDSTWNGLDDSYILKIVAPCNSQKPSALQSNKNNICINDNTTITLTSTGGYGDTLKWYKGACGQTYVGKNTPLTIPKPNQTTTYYARWQTACDTSACDSIRINIVSQVKDSINPVICQGQLFHIGTHYYSSTGVYKDTLLTVSGCDSIVTINLSVVSLPIINLGNDTILCPGKTVFLNAYINGSTYLWQDGTTTTSFNVIHQGTYWVKVTSPNNCTFTDTIHVYYYPTPPVYSGFDTILCTGQTTTLNATNTNCTYQWQDGSTNPTLFVTQQGIYWVRIKDTNNCYTTDTAHVTFTSPPVVNLGNDTVICYWQSLILSAVNPNCHYLWQNGSTFSNQAANTQGTYWCTAYVNNACYSSDTVNVIYKPSPMVNLGLDTIMCNGYTLNLNVYTPYATYIWQNGSTASSFNVTQPGTYWVKVSINSSCYYGDTINVSYIPSPTVNLGNDTTLCPGNTVILNATYPNATYHWQNNASTPTFNVTQQGVYWVKVSLLNNCYKYDTIVVNYSPVPQINLGNDTVLCQGQSLILNATFLNSTYLWQNGATTPTYTVSNQGMYWVQVANSISCTNRDTINVSYSPSVFVNLGNDTTLCQGDTLKLNVTTPFSTYLWQDATTNSIYNVSNQGIYWVKLTNQYGCFKYDSINVNYMSLPFIDLGNDTTLCKGQTLLLKATLAGVNYLWQDNSTNSTYNATHQGLYWVKVTNQSNCSFKDTINIFYSNPNLNLGPDLTLCNGKSIELNVGNKYISCLWQDNSTDSIFNINKQGVYWVTVVDNYNCIASDTINILYEDCDTPGIYIPNCFTPNGDGLNDIFKIETTYNFSDFKLYIYNRWGELIFESYDKDSGWDGTYRLKPVPNGIYVYLMVGTIKNTNDFILKKSGSVTLIR